MRDSYGLEGSDVETAIKMVLVKLDETSERLDAIEHTLSRAQGTMDKFAQEVLPVIDSLLPMVNDMMNMPLLKALLPKQPKQTKFLHRKAVNDAPYDVE